MRLKRFDFNIKDNKKKKSIIGASIIVLVLLVGITIYATFAAYKDVKTYNIIQGKVDTFINPDVSVAIKLRDTEGNETTATDFPDYLEYSYLAEESSCKNGSTITFNESDWTATIASSSKDKCTLYFEQRSTKTLQEAILANNTIVTTTQSFTTLSTDASENIYQTQDDLGTAYYFRGNPTNNYVKLGSWLESTGAYVIEGPNEVFTSLTECETALNSDYSGAGLSCKEYLSIEEGSSMYWRILRINGDGTIRLIYDGINVESSTDDKPLIAYDKYSEYNGDPKYYGLTYDNGSGVQVDNKVKTILENWYTTNLKAKYGKYIADSIFCNDTSIGDGETYYNTYKRTVSGKSPILTCTQDADKYSVNASIGNGYLSEPIGLASADEVLMAGNYIYTGTSAINNYYGYLTMSPYSYKYSNTLLILGYYPSTIDSNGPVTIQGQYRPVISLNANIKLYGSGSQSDPYRLTK